MYICAECMCIYVFDCIYGCVPRYARLCFLMVCMKVFVEIASSRSQYLYMSVEHPCIYVFVGVFVCVQVCLVVWGSYDS